MEALCHPPIEDDTKRLYIIYEGDIPSPWLKNVFRDCIPSREIDRPIFPLIDLMSRLHCSEAALQLAENLTFMLL
jgi:hypothetical protein